MNHVEIFKNPEFGSVRIIEENGKYLFCGTDVARALGYARPNEAVSKHCKGTLKRRTPTAGGIQEMLFIPEGDVYRLIVHSKLPSAERFERWVFDEVLPSAALREENARLAGKAAFYDLFIDLKHSTNLRTTAKELVVPERQFVRFLLEQRFVYRTASGNVLPYAKPSNNGLFCVKDFCNHGHIGSYTLVTPQGKLYFAELRDLILMVV